MVAEFIDEETHHSNESNRADGDVENLADAQGSEDPNGTAVFDYTGIIETQAARIDEQAERIDNLLSQIDALIRNGTPVTQEVGNGNGSASTANNPMLGSAGKHEGVKPMEAYTFDDFKI